MKRKLSALSERYAKALRKHLHQGLRASLQPALGLGRQAVGLGMETLELARVHERAIAPLLPPGNGHLLRKQAESFFTEAISPILETHRVLRKSKMDLNRLAERLDRRTAQLAASNRLLQRGIARRKRVEAALETSGVHYGRLLKNSLQLQSRLRQLTHQMLSAQENERKSISHELQDEIAQNLLGINTRLLSLKLKARANTKGLKNEIASTQRLVVKSAKSVRQAARQFRRA